MTKEQQEAVEEAIRLAEIGEYLYSAKSFAAGNGYDEPREFSISWEWQQSKPNECGQGVLLAEAARWHEQQAEDGTQTEAAKLRTLLSLTEAQEAEAVEPVCQKCKGTRLVPGIGEPGYPLETCEDCRRTSGTLQADLDRAAEALKPFAALHDETLKHGLAARDPAREAWAFNDAPLRWGDFAKARETLAAITKGQKP